MAKPLLYFDISSEESGGSLFQVQEGSTSSFLYHHSTYNDDNDDMKVYQTAYPTFAAFWKELTKDRHWFYQHPLFVHPDVRAFVQQQLQDVDWSVQGDFKWQDSHRKQWKKVLSDPGTYYNPL
jgi:hypothetical protein